MVYITKPEKVSIYINTARKTAAAGESRNGMRCDYKRRAVQYVQLPPGL
jgi:hypothetical protein